MLNYYEVCRVQRCRVELKTFNGSQGTSFNEFNELNEDSCDLF